MINVPSHIEVINPTDKAHWLNMRMQDVTSTDCAALFGLSPYRTAFELWHEKAAGVAESFAPNERMLWGNRLESAVAYGIAEDEGWQVEPLKAYMRDPAARLGSSFDFAVDHPTKGPGLLEIKVVDAMIYRNAWRDDGAGNIEAPEHIELQLQHQLAVTGFEWGAIGALVGGNSTKVVLRERDEAIGNAIRVKVAQFWDSIQTKTPPPIDYVRDADMIAQLYASANADEVLDVTGDANIESMVRLYQQLGADIDQREDQRKAIKAQLLELAGTAGKVVGSWGSIAMTRTKDSPGKPITADMVGTLLGGRTGYRQFRVNIKDKA